MNTYEYFFIRFGQYIDLFPPAEQPGAIALLPVLPAANFPDTTPHPHARIPEECRCWPRRDIGPDKQAVECYEGREISFMTAHTQELLRDVQEKVCFIPEPSPAS